MLKTRVIPCLLLSQGGLVKTVKFKNPSYVGDPVNAIKIFNEKEVDELIFLDISATVEGREPDFEVVQAIASECFMPLAFGGGVRSLDHARSLFSMGIEKVCLNSSALERPEFISEVAAVTGSQSIVIAIDVRRGLWGRYEVFGEGGRRKTERDPISWAREVESRGAGEILLTSINRDGTQQGYDLELIKRVSSAVSIPVIACGGAGKLSDLGQAVRVAGASAVAAGSMFVYFGRHRAVLINYPGRHELAEALGETAGGKE